MDYGGPPVEIAAPVAELPSQVEIPVFVKPTSRCSSSDADEIVVCARDPEKFRLRPAPERFVEEKGLPRTRFQTSETTSVSAELEAENVGGFPSNRVMVKAKLKF